MRCRRTRFAIVAKNNKINAKIRIVHGNLDLRGKRSRLLEQKVGKCTYPTLGSRFLNAMGKIVPPTEDPQARMPSARPRRRLNQWEIIPSTGPNIVPEASCRSMK